MRELLNMPYVRHPLNSACLGYIEGTMSTPSQEPNFEGLHVAAFESRRADDMARLIERNPRAFILGR